MASFNLTQHHTCTIIRAVMGYHARPLLWTWTRFRQLRQGDTATRRPLRCTSWIQIKRFTTIKASTCSRPRDPSKCSGTVQTAAKMSGQFTTMNLLAAQLLDTILHLVVVQIARSLRQPHPIGQPTFGILCSSLFRHQRRYIVFSPWAPFYQPVVARLLSRRTKSNVLHQWFSHIPFRRLPRGNVPNAPGLFSVRST